MPLNHRKRTFHALYVSSGLHLALLLGVSLEGQSKGARPALALLAVPEVVEGEYLDSTIDPLSGSEMPAKVQPPRAPEDVGGAAQHEHPDTLERGHAGQSRASARALNQAAHVDPLTLERQALNNLHVTQVQRVRTGHVRRSRDQRRTERRPMELTFVDTGSLAKAFSVLGSRQIAGELLPALGQTQVVVRASNSLVNTSGSHLNEPATEAKARARPAVPTARFALVAESYGSPSDTRLSPARVSTAVQALQHASTLGGPVGPGVGGEPALGTPGIGGSGLAGASSSNLGNASRRGDIDPILGQYLQRLRRSVDWGHAFPTWAVAEGRGGIAIVRMTILANGRLAELQLLRASGVEEFDQNLVAAIHRAAPFAPIPATLGRSSLALNFSFDATNPAVGRDGSGPGGRRSETLANIP